ncbi:MAG: hypothetical protein IPI48_12670 [bacterium]|nr:hypothetical protein [bacterium]
MPQAQASDQERRLLRALAADPSRATATQRALYDLMAHGLTVADACDALWHWIVEDRPVKRTLMHGQDDGQPAFEIWPELVGRKFYCKFLVRGNPLVQQLLLVVSAHPDDPHSPSRGSPS